MAKPKVEPKSILNLFYQGGTRASIGTTHEPEALEKLLTAARGRHEDVRIETTNEDETVEKDIAFIGTALLLFYTIFTPRTISNLIATAPAGLSLDKSVQ